VSLLNQFFTVLTDVAYAYDGTIFNMAGDCLLIGFGVPFAQADSTVRAVRASLEMQHQFREVSAGWKKLYNGPIGLGIGINKGEMIVGNVGSHTYMSYTVIGDTVNVASRLMSQAGAGEIILSGSVHQALGEQAFDFAMQAIPPMSLKGKAQPLEVYKITANG